MKRGRAAKRGARRWRPPAEAPRCTICGKPAFVCVCAELAPLATVLRIVILQHPREQDRDLGTAPLVLGSLQRAEKHVGLSWPSLRRLLGDETAAHGGWAVVYPQPPKGAAVPPADAGEVQVFDRHGALAEGLRLAGVIVLDGSWSQAKALWWRNPWLLKLARIVVSPAQASIYGRLRREPRRDYVSTLEAVGAALTALGEPATIEVQLKRVLRRMVQRARDGGGSSAASEDPAHRDDVDSTDDVDSP